LTSSTNGGLAGAHCGEEDGAAACGTSWEDDAAAHAPSWAVTSVSTIMMSARNCRGGGRREFTVASGGEGDASGSRWEGIASSAGEGRGRGETATCANSDGGNRPSRGDSDTGDRFSYRWEHGTGTRFFKVAFLFSNLG
jgi:hypothetical protein